MPPQRSNALPRSTPTDLKHGNTLPPITASAAILPRPAKSKPVPATTAKPQDSHAARCRDRTRNPRLALFDLQD